MVDAQYPTDNTDSSTDWSVIIAEKLDSSGGSAGDEVTLNITATSPTNKFIELRLPIMQESLASKDKTQHITGNVHLTTILGALTKTFALKNVWIKGKKITEYNALRKTLENWMQLGNSQSGISALYMGVKGQQAGSTKYWVFKVNGTWQNWALITVKKVDNQIAFDIFKSTIKLEFSEN